jgi:hypothetical protein
MPDLTEEEYAVLDEYYTENPPKVNPTKKGTGFFTQRRDIARTITIDSLSADYLTVKAIASHKTPAEIISELIQKEIAATMSSYN